MEDINTVVAKNLRRIRDSRSVSLEELARLSGVSRSMLVRIEKGTEIRRSPRSGRSPTALGCRSMS